MATVSVAPLLALVALTVGAAACSSSDAPNGTGSDASVDAPPSDAAPEASPDAAPDALTGDAAIPPGFCTSETPTITTTGAGLTATTTHYTLYAETSSADATDMARLLEASGAAFASWFERPQPTQKLKVNYYKDEPSWAAGLMADGIMVPAEAGGYYSPTTKTAYLYKQGNPYYSHVLLVHEATHQYHYITRLQGQALPFWYVEGHAEYLSRHDWDGQCVRLGVTSLLSWEDLPSVAMGEGAIDVPGLVGGSVQGSRADAWALFRYLDTGSHEAGFKAFRDAFDANMNPSFASLVADPASLSAPLVAWVPTAQEPMKPIFTEWIHVGPHAVDVATPVYFSLALVKETNVSHFEAKFQVPPMGNWTVGAIVSYVDSQHYVGVVHGSDGKVQTFTANGSAVWASAGMAPLPGGAVESIAVDFAGGMANVAFNGTAHSFPTPSARAGLAASDTSGHFVDVSWTP